MNKERFLKNCCVEFELDDYVLVREFPEELTKEDFKNFMLEKYSNGEFMTIHHLTVFVAFGCYDKLKEGLEKAVSYYLDMATDYKIALKTLEDLEDNYRESCWRDGRLVLIRNGELVRGVITEQNKNSVNKELQNCSLGEEVRLKFDEQGNLIQKTFLYIDGILA